MSACNRHGIDCFLLQLSIGDFSLFAAWLSDEIVCQYHSYCKPGKLDIVFVGSL